MFHTEPPSIRCQSLSSTYGKIPGTEAEAKITFAYSSLSKLSISNCMNYPDMISTDPANNFLSKVLSPIIVSIKWRRGDESSRPNLDVNPAKYPSGHALHRLVDVIFVHKSTIY